jgi:cytochrome c-type biogenesis protein CcmE
VTAREDVSTYADFKTAINTEKTVKVVGQLAKDKEIYYDAGKDPNYFTFYVKDNEGMEKKVVLYKSKPQDFELSEQIVITGKMKGDEFIASDLLMKCPSKYKDEEIYLKSEKG